MISVTSNINYILASIS